MSGIDHLVLCGHDLDAMRETYRSLGFTLTPQAQHPFGTGNSLVQLDHCFLELLTVAAPEMIPEHRPAHFSFGAFNRDYLARREGFSMLVLESADARADVARFRAAGLQTYESFDFSRKAKLPDGKDVMVGFSLAFASHPAMPRAGFFTCQQHAPQHFWKPEYQRHINRAATILEVCLVAEDPSHIGAFVGQFADAPAEPVAGGNRVRTDRGSIRIVSPEAFANRYGLAPPRPTEGPEFMGFTIGVGDGAFIEKLALGRVGERWIVPPDRAFGTAIAFAELKRQ